MGSNRRSLARRWRDAGDRCLRSARAIPRATRILVRLPRAEQRATLRALLTLACVEATIRWVRLPRLAEMLGVRMQVHPPALPSTAALGGDVTFTGPAPETELPTALVTARRSVDRLMRLWPLGAGPCLRESLVLGHLIRDRDPVLRLGVARHGYRVRAHAWVEVGGLPVNDPEGFTAFGSERDQSGR
jgi:hypothetical protein